MREGNVRMSKSILLITAVAIGVLLACGIALSMRSEPARAAFPGPNGKIVFVEQDEQERDEGIKLINPNGTGVTTLVEKREGTFLHDPAFSPDGKRVAFARGTDWPNTEIYKINIANRQVTQITDNHLVDFDPAWSPDGDRIAFVRGEYVRHSITNTDIVVRNADGTGKTVNLTNIPDENESAPAWSPNGKKIAFYNSTTADIYVVNLETEQVRNLTNDGTAYRDYDPNWSPDGTRIVFNKYGHEDRAGTNGDYVDRINTMDASDGSDQRSLAAAWSDDYGGAYFENPTYSPSGEQIAYVKTSVDYVYNRPRLIKMNASTGGNKQLVYDAYNPGPGRYPYAEVMYLLSPDWGVRAQP